MVTRRSHFPVSAFWRVIIGVFNSSVWKSAKCFMFTDSKNKVEIYIKNMTAYHKCYKCFFARLYTCGGAVIQLFYGVYNYCDTSS